MPMSGQRKNSFVMNSSTKAIDAPMMPVVQTKGRPPFIAPYTFGTTLEAAPSRRGQIRSDFAIPALAERHLSSAAHGPLPAHQGRPRTQGNGPIRGSSPPADTGPAGKALVVSAAGPESYSLLGRRSRQESEWISLYYLNIFLV